jgi:hypothetical protein
MHDDKISINKAKLLNNIKRDTIERKNWYSATGDSISEKIVLKYNRVQFRILTIPKLFFMKGLLVLQHFFFTRTRKFHHPVQL